MNSVKIISGEYGGRKIATPGGGTHPMGERERLALFNMISPWIEGASVLDAYAGSGVLGIETLSRGAKEVVFIEKAAGAVETIRENLRNLGVEKSRVRILREKVGDYEDGGQFEVILADPPYDKYDLGEVMKLVKYLKIGGILVLSHPGEAQKLKGLILEKSRRYAGATLSLYHH